MNGVSVSPFTLSHHLLKPIKAWISWLNLSVLLGTLALALFNASRDVVAQSFAYAYALISVGVLVNICKSVIRIKYAHTRQAYGFVIYQNRITMIRKRDPGHYG